MYRLDSVRCYQSSLEKKHTPNNVGQIALERQAGQFNSARQIFLRVQKRQIREGFQPELRSSRLQHYTLGYQTHVISYATIAFT